IIEISTDPLGTMRTHIANSFTTYRHSHPSNPKEFFLIESRIKSGRNDYIPDEGLLIWHIDEDGSNENEQMTPAQHYLVSVEQADGQFHLEMGNNRGGSGDLFHRGRWPYSRSNRPGCRRTRTPRGRCTGCAGRPPASGESAKEAGTRGGTGHSIAARAIPGGNGRSRSPTEP
ncbi:MAG: hypothetical protein V3V97_06740, partial [Hyphomicrobiaceae bacterium]